MSATNSPLRRLARTVTIADANEARARAWVGTGDATIAEWDRAARELIAAQRPLIAALGLDADSPVEAVTAAAWDVLDRRI